MKEKYNEKKLYKTKAGKTYTLSFLQVFLVAIFHNFHFLVFLIQLFLKFIHFFRWNIRIQRKNYYTLSNRQVIEFQVANHSTASVCAIWSLLFSSPVENVEQKSQESIVR